MPHFGLHRRSFIPLVYGVSEIFLTRPVQSPSEISPVNVDLAYFSPPDSLVSNLQNDPPSLLKWYME